MKNPAQYVCCKLWPIPVGVRLTYVANFIDWLAATEGIIPQARSFQICHLDSRLSEKLYYTHSSETAFMNISSSMQISLILKFFRKIR